MNTSDSIELLFKQGVVQINFGWKMPEEKYLAEVRQVVQTDNDGQTHLVHQIASSSIVGCLQQAQAQVNHANVIPVSFRKN